MPITQPGELKLTPGMLLAKYLNNEPERFGDPAIDE
jgi:hypothetical protein